MDNTTFLERYRLMFPEFKAIPDVTVLLFKEQAECRVTRKVWGRFYQDGLCYLTAHLVMISRGLDGRPVTDPVIDVTSQSVSDVSCSVASGKATGTSYNTTIYGQQYFELRDIVGKPVLKVW